VPVGRAAPGQVLAVRSVVLTAWGPAVPLRGTRSDPNNNSIVLTVLVGGVSVLLAGDAEVEEQRELRAAGVGHVDVLKVAHHGSAFQDPALLDAIAPAVAPACCAPTRPATSPSPSKTAG
jgi:competence protein ComEC